ncbi:MAG TPA: helix-turn-helix transcriptional regulator [Pyrinomonadaceae bacterium]|nr:helix-turn-helix transcriptional regulator [Pyrinomonadaceae bacterium]
MGVKARQKPARLAEKLLQVREALGLSQNELINRLGVELAQNRISDYELGKGEPSLPLLLSYARLAGVCLERLVDDELDLPDKLPGKSRHRP